MVVPLRFLANYPAYVPLKICFNNRRKDFIYLNLLKVHQANINISKINDKVFTPICKLKVEFSVLLQSLDPLTCFISLLLRFISISISSPNNNSTFHCVQTVWRKTYPVWWSIAVIPLSRLIWAIGTLQSCSFLITRDRWCISEEGHLQFTVFKTMVLPTCYPYCSYQFKKETAYCTRVMRLKVRF